MLTSREPELHRSHDELGESGTDPDSESIPGTICWTEPLRGWVEWGGGDEPAYGYCIWALSQQGGLQPSVGGPTPQRADAAIRTSSPQDPSTSHPPFLHPGPLVAPVEPLLPHAVAQRATERVLGSVVWLSEEIPVRPRLPSWDWFPRSYPFHVAMNNPPVCFQEASGFVSTECQRCLTLPCSPVYHAPL